MMILKGDETPQDIICLAYGLEEGLRKFYAASTQMAIAPEVVKVLSKLAEIEVRHKQKLFDLYKIIDSADTTIESFEKKVNSELMEGGFDSDKLLAGMAIVPQKPPAFTFKPSSMLMCAVMSSPSWVTSMLKGALVL